MEVMMPRVGAAESAGFLRALLAGVERAEVVKGAGGGVRWRGCSESVDLWWRWRWRWRRWPLLRRHRGVSLLPLLLQPPLLVPLERACQVCSSLQRMAQIFCASVGCCERGNLGGGGEALVRIIVTGVATYFFPVHLTSSFPFQCFVCS